MQKTIPINPKYLINNHLPMKSFFYGLFTILLMLGSVPTFAQIGIGTETPAPSAALEITSSTNDKGVLIPRLSNTQKNSISNPAEGLLIYQTTAPIGFYYYTGSAWKLMAIQTDIAGKVDKVDGKELSTNDYTTAEKTKLSAITGSNTGDQTTITGNAGTATKLATARNINGVAFDGSADILIAAAASAEQLTGTTIKSTVTGSSLTSVGTLANLTVTNPIAGSITGTASNVTGIVVIANGGTNSTATATAGGIGYGTSTAHAYTAAGTTGQVLSSNGAGVPTWTTPSGGVGGFTHYLGEAFNGGIIYYLYKGSDGLEHGLIVALNASTAQWQSTNSLVNSNRTEDGAFNTNLMTNSPAAGYIASLGAGWYLPSIDELGLLYYNRYSAQKSLRAGGNTLLLSTLNYWSSTEIDANYAVYFGLGSGHATSNLKTYTNTVRGVRAF